jgi:hypothetical protein
MGFILLFPRPFTQSYLHPQVSRTSRNIPSRRTFQSYGLHPSQSSNFRLAEHTSAMVSLPDFSYLLYHQHLYLKARSETFQTSEQSFVEGSEHSFQSVLHVEVRRPDGTHHVPILLR